MVGPTPEGNSMNTGESSLHNVGKISTPSPMDKRKFRRKANRRAAEECALDADFADERRLLEIAQQRDSRWCLNRWLARTPIVA
jgi:hypothetical protein